MACDRITGACRKHKTVRHVKLISVTDPQLNARWRTRNTPASIFLTLWSC